MAQQYPHRSRPFMAKELFDLVSNEIWGYNALDYTKNYLIRRATWSDVDIREEALYYAGLAHGIRSGQAGSGPFQKPSQSMIYGGMPTLGYSRNDYRYGYNPMASYFGDPHGFRTGYHSQTESRSQSGLHPGFPSPCLKATDIALGLCPPNHVWDMPLEYSPYRYFGYGAMPAEYTGREASMGLYSPRHLNPVASSSHSLPSGTDARHGYPDAAQLDQMQKQQQFQAACRQDNTVYPGMPTSHTSTGLPIPKATATSTTPYHADPQQIAKATAARAGVPGRANAFGEHSFFGGKIPSTRLTDDQASRHRTQEPSPHSASQTPAASPKKTGAFTATVEDPSEEDRSDEDYPRVDTPSVQEEVCDCGGRCGGSAKSMGTWFEEQGTDSPSAREESCDCGDSIQSMEDWFDEQGERDISHMSSAW